MLGGGGTDGSSAVVTGDAALWPDSRCKEEGEKC